MNLEILRLAMLLFMIARGASLVILHGRSVLVRANRLSSIHLACLTFFLLDFRMTFV